MSANPPIQPNAAHATILSLRAALLDLAARSALLRIARQHGSDPDIRRLGDRLRDDMEALGKRHQYTGEDARANPIFAALEYDWVYADAFERGRRVVLEEVTTVAIYEALQRENTLVWDRWEVEVRGECEVDDEYGQPCFESEIHVTEAGGVAAPDVFVGVSPDTARAIYRRITGRAIGPDDLLRDDHPRLAESGPWWESPESEEAHEEAAASCGYTCSADREHEGAMAKFHFLARAAHDDWLAKFDDDGRYYDPYSGFWASLNGEVRDGVTGMWALAGE